MKWIDCIYMNRDLLESKDFQDAIKTVQEEAIPYFSMLTSKGPNESSGICDSNKQTDQVKTEKSLDDEAPVEVDVHKGVIEKEKIELEEADIATDLSFVSLYTVSIFSEKFCPSMTMIVYFGTLPILFLFPYLIAFQYLFVKIPN